MALTRKHGVWAALAGLLGFGGAYYARRRNRRVVAVQNGSRWRGRSARR
jgi:hypothetical protein